MTQLYQLQQGLKQSLSPIYMIESDEILLARHAKKLIIDTAKQADFNQHELLFIEPGFGWERLLTQTDHLSLFNEKTVIDLINPNDKFDATGNKTLQHYIESPPEDKLLIITIKKWPKLQQKQQWYQYASKQHIHIKLAAITANQLPQWITTKLNHHKLSFDQDSVKLLAQLTEGNLLATAQAIEKLRLLFANRPITIDAIKAVTQDNANFSIYDLANQALAGQTQQTMRILMHLQQENIEPVLILWSLTKELRELAQYALQLQRGVSIHQLTQKVWRAKKTIL